MASEQQVIGQCAAIDVFEEAVTLRRAVTVRLRGGEEFTAHVDDVVTEGDDRQANQRRLGWARSTCRSG